MNRTPTRIHRMPSRRYRVGGLAICLGSFLVAAVTLDCRPVLAQETDKPAVLSPELQIYPVDLAASPDGAIYVADRRMHGVWKWDADKLSAFYTGVPKFRTPLNAVRTVAIDKDGLLLAGDSATREIYRFDKTGKPEAITGGKIGIPYDMAVASDGTLYVTDLEMHQVVRIKPGSSKVEHIADLNPRAIAIDSQDRLWVLTQDAAQLVIIGADGKVEPVVSKRVFNFPQNVVVNSAGEAYVTDSYEKAIWKVLPGQEPKIWFQGAPLDNPVGMILVDDLPVIVDPRARKVFKFDAQAKPTVLFEITAKTP